MPVGVVAVEAGCGVGVTGGGVVWVGAGAVPTWAAGCSGCLLAKKKKVPTAAAATTAPPMAAGIQFTGPDLESSGRLRIS